jgi:hypothetical protein
MFARRVGHRFVRTPSVKPSFPIGPGPLPTIGSSPPYLIDRLFTREGQRQFGNSRGLRKTPGVSVRYGYKSGHICTGVEMHDHPWRGAGLLVGNGPTEITQFWCQRRTVTIGADQSDHVVGVEKAQPPNRASNASHCSADFVLSAGVAAPVWSVLLLAYLGAGRPYRN